MTVPVGAPAWADLAADDAGSARDFYTRLFGWRWREVTEYSIAFKDAKPVAGVLPRPPGVPTSWNVYLECGGADRAVERVQQLGGTVLTSPVTTPNDEKFLIIRDPAGTVTGLWESPPRNTFGHGDAGMLRWAELHTPDSGVDQFYADLLGYRQERESDNSSSTWFVQDQPLLGRVTTSPEDPQPPHWQLYFQVNPEQDTDTAAAKARELGGQVVQEPADTPHGRTALLADNSGAAFAVIDHRAVG
ncbi:VOC family protein [Saccharopolyspora rectivirgula]|uniref:VOC family protein n=1 Tax=Saccharopolyspora rectivirgula TaxID=28042 RepID=UPI00240968F7|nr:VOC family protein [Saccharopolyspora rectivirgula]